MKAARQRQQHSMSWLTPPFAAARRLISSRHSPMIATRLGPKSRSSRALDRCWPMIHGRPQACRLRTSPIPHSSEQQAPTTRIQRAPRPPDRAPPTVAARRRQRQCRIRVSDAGPQLIGSIMYLRAGEGVAVTLRDEPVRVRVEGVASWAYTRDPDPIDVCPEEALREVIREFKNHAYSCYSATAWVPGEGTAGTAMVFRRPRRVLHVIGTSKLAEHFRELLREGVAGWTLHPMPATRTLLEIAEPTLGHRAYKLLTREGIHDPRGARGHPRRSVAEAAQPRAQGIGCHPSSRGHLLRYFRRAPQRSRHTRRPPRAHRRCAQSCPPGAQRPAHGVAGSVQRPARGGRRHPRLAGGRTHSAGRPDGHPPAQDRW
jgi:hypothetical protein